MKIVVSTFLPVHHSGVSVDGPRMVGGPGWVAGGRMRTAPAGAERSMRPAIPALDDDAVEMVRALVLQRQHATGSKVALGAEIWRDVAVQVVVAGAELAMYMVLHELLRADGDIADYYYTPLVTIYHFR